MSDESTMLEISGRIGEANGEPEFLATVRRLKPIGYGRMIQIIQTEWARSSGRGVPNATANDSQLRWLAAHDPLFRDSPPSEHAP